MASLSTVRLNRGDSSSWGFRLQGGKDFGTPLVIQKVNGGSPAERAGLVAGDAVIKINNIDVYNLLHKEAQDVIVRSGSNFDMVIQRGGSTWKPTVVPTGTFPKPSPVINNVSPVTQTSLAANKRENIGAIGTGHNVSAQPFNTQVNGAVNGGPKLVNKQYNSPLKLYSEDAIAESLSAQTEVLSTGALGVNFKKNEKDYDASNSAVYRMLQEAENDRDVNDQSVTRSDYYASHSHAIGGGRLTASPRPTTPSAENFQSQKPDSTSESATICTDCERVIVGVFVRIKDKNLHVECFKCATCGSSLKNVGYYNINNKLYCDIHAKAAAIAINNPSAIPITLSSGGKAPASAISAALSSHSYPSSPLSAKAPSYTPSYQPSNFSGPKPFSSVSAPLSPGGNFPRAAPLSPQSNYNKAPLSPSVPSYGSYSPSSTAERCTNITWPPTHEDSDVPTACPLFYPPPSRVEAELEKKIAKKKQLDFESACFAEESDDINIDETMSFYSEELSISGRRSATECVELLSETLDTQKLVENAIKASPQLVLPPLHTGEIVDQKLCIKTEGATSTEKCCQIRESCELKRLVEFKPNTLECELSSKVENAVPQKWESSLTQAARTVAPDSDTFSLIPSRHSAKPMASALAIAPSEPFNSKTYSLLEPVPLPEMTEPYFPPEHPIIPLNNAPEIKKEDSPIPQTKSSFIKAMEIAPERPFTPVGGVAAAPPVKKKTNDPLDKVLADLPKPAEKLNMRSALTTAPERAYTPIITEFSDTESKHHKQQNIDRSQLIKPLKPEELPLSFQMNIKEPKPPSYYAPAVIEERISINSQDTTSDLENKETQIVEKETIKVAQICQPLIAVSQEPQTTNFAPVFQGFTCSFKNKTEHSQFSVEVCTTPPIATSPPKAQNPISYIATVEQKPSIITTEKIVQETSNKHQISQSYKNNTYESKLQKQAAETQSVQRQAEETVQVKPLSVTEMLHKAEALPSYQVELQAAAESELRIMEKKRKAEERIEEQKREREKKLAQHKIQEYTPQSQDYNERQQEENKSRSQQAQDEVVCQHQLEKAPVKQAPSKPERQHPIKPSITVELDKTNNVKEKVNFQTVANEKQPSATFSPRPRSMTPSMINKAPALLPYYQDNLVAHFHAPVLANVLDPATPVVSRSPSPRPDIRTRSPSPFLTKPRLDRAKSPAQGPPSNPLQSLSPLPSPQDSRIKQAKENLKTYLPEYKIKRDMIKQHCVVDNDQNYDKWQQTTMDEISQTVAYPKTHSGNQFSVQTENVQYLMQSQEQQQLQVSDTQKQQTQISQDATGSCKMDILEKSHHEQLAASGRSQSQSTETSADKATQIQRRKTVTEELEESHKETNIQIEKNICSGIGKYPFTKVNVPLVEPPTVQSIHITSPQHILSRSKAKESRLAQQIVQNLDSQNTLQQASQQITKLSQLSQKENQIQPPLNSDLIPQTQPVPPQPPTRRVFPPGSLAPIKHVTPPGVCLKPSQNFTKPIVPNPDVGAGSGRQTAGITAAPKRGRGLLNAAAVPGSRVPLCGHCHGQIRGPFITALGKIWCPQHFICTTPSCRRPLQDLGFVEERGQLYCEYCFEQYLAPPCSKCNGKIKGDCLKAIGKNFHPECFNCVYCGKLFGNSPFFLEDGNPYCDADWNELFTTKCYACGFPVEAGDRWVEALSNNYHSQCFNCTMCKRNLEGQSFFAKGGRPFCKNHAR